MHPGTPRGPAPWRSASHGALHAVQLLLLRLLAVLAVLGGEEGGAPPHLPHRHPVAGGVGSGQHLLVPAAHAGAAGVMGPRTYRISHVNF